VASQPPDSGAAGNPEIPGAQAGGGDTSSGSNDDSSASDGGPIGDAGSVFLLDSANLTALSMTGNADVAAAAVYVNAGGSSSVTLTGSASVHGALFAFGGVNGAKNVSGSVAANRQSRAANPYASVPALDCSKLAGQNAALKINKSTTLKPGAYSSLDISGNAQVTLQAGKYCFTSITASGGSLHGDNVLVYLRPTSASASATALSVTGNTEIDLSAAPGGDGIALLLNNGTISATGSAVINAKGGVYGPTASYSGTGTAKLNVGGGSLVIDKASLTGNSRINLNGGSCHHDGDDE